MILIVCTDKRNGLSFNHIRQTYDRGIVKQIMQHKNASEGLTVSPYTAEYILKSADESHVGTQLEKKLTVTNDLDEILKSGKPYFLEDGSEEFIETLINNAEKIIQFVWDTTYPATVSLPDLIDHPKMRLAYSESVSGTTHPNVTKNIFKRVKN